MGGRRRSHSDARWALLPPTVIRCNATRPNGSRCKREAEDGAVVCDQHGGAAAQVRRRAAERLIMTADQAAQKLTFHLVIPAAWTRPLPSPGATRAISQTRQRGSGGLRRRWNMSPLICRCAAGTRTSAAGRAVHIGASCGEPDPLPRKPSRARI
jgi:hypothetical protein